MSAAFEVRWTDKQLNALCDGWKAGMSMGEIADWVGRSRNAVAGKLFRLGIKLNKSECRKRKRAGQTKAQTLMRLNRSHTPHEQSREVK